MAGGIADKERVDAGFHEVRDECVPQGVKRRDGVHFAVLALD